MVRSDSDPSQPMSLLVDQGPPTSPCREQPMSPGPEPEPPTSPCREQPNSPSLEPPTSPGPESELPTSPCRDQPMSPCREQPNSPSLESPTSPCHEQPMSSCHEQPTSPGPESHQDAAAASSSLAIEIDSDSDEDDGRPSLSTGVSIRLRQYGGELQQVNIQSGWMDKIANNHWLNDDLVWFFSMKAACLVSRSELLMASPHFYTTIILKGRIDKWPLSSRVVCLPVCVNQHWSLIATTSKVSLTGERTATIYHFDSLNSRMKLKQPVREVESFLKKCGVTRPQTRLIKVPAQANDYDCGLHVIQNATSIVKLLAKQNDIDTLIQGHQFVYSLDRTSLIEELQEIPLEALKANAYWGYFEDIEDEKRHPWPCRRVSSSFAKRLVQNDEDLDNDEDLIPVSWINRAPGDPLISWIKECWVKPIGVLSLKAALAHYTTDPDERERFLDAYQYSLM